MQTFLSTTAFRASGVPELFVRVVASPFVSTHAHLAFSLGSRLAPPLAVYSVPRRGVE